MRRVSFSSFWFPPRGADFPRPRSPPSRPRDKSSPPRPPAKSSSASARAISSYIASASSNTPKSSSFVHDVPLTSNAGRPEARSIFTLVPVRPRSRGERRSLRTFPPPPPPLVAAPAAQQTRRVNSVRSSDGASPPAMETKSSGAAAADASIARAALRVEGPFKAMISGWSSKASEAELKGNERGVSGL